MRARNLALGILFAVAACSANAPTPAQPPPPPPSGSDTGFAQPPGTPPPATKPPATTCEGPAPGPDYKCVQDCGPPVARAGDPPPGWSWLSAEQVKRREMSGCPRCLPPDARIATPGGERAISTITVGTRVFTIDVAGRRAIAPVLQVDSAQVGGRHVLIRVTLADGRVVAGSAGHPVRDGTLGELRAGDALDGSTVTHVEHVPFTGQRTWDILPAGSTGLYIANGVVLRSTFFEQPR
jgi:hypothetical protein